MLLNHDTVSLLAGMGRIIEMAFYLPYLLIFASILGIIWLSYKAYQTRYSLKGSKIRFKRFYCRGYIYIINRFKWFIRRFRGNKRISRSYFY